MSRKYQNTKDVPTAALIVRLRELSDAIAGGRAATESEFSMRVPAECDRDADLVLAEAAERLNRVCVEGLLCHLAQMATCLKTIEAREFAGEIYAGIVNGDFNASAD